MSLLSRLDAKFGRYAVPHLTVFLIVGQVIAYVANSAPVAAGGAPLLENIQLVADPDKNVLVIMKDGTIYKNTLPH